MSKPAVKGSRIQAAPQTNPGSEKPVGSFWHRYRADIAAIAAIYLVTLILFWPFVSENTRFSAGGDAAAARAWNAVGESIATEEGRMPIWNPYVFLGFPTFGSLSYHPHIVQNVVDDIAVVGKYIFGVQPLNRQVFYYFISGVAMFLFVRGVGLPVWGALLAGLVFLLNPYNISLAEAGHGSKHWTIALMPLVMLLTHRVISRQRLLDVAFFALALAAQFLSLHVQIVYYTLLVAGVYVLVWFVTGVIRRQVEAWKGIAGFAAGGLLGLGLAACLYWPVYVFQKFSIRGTPPLRADASATGGLDWMYATNWSLHPLELLQLLVPGLYGLGGSKALQSLAPNQNLLDFNLYWGWMPFTQSSLYMGIIPLILAIFATSLLWKRDRIVRWMAISVLLATILSFGRFLPVLYGPMYHLLPFFAKFRVPSMAMVVTAAGVAVLAAYGLRDLLTSIRTARDNKTLAAKRANLFYVLTGIGTVGLLTGLFGEGTGPWFDGFIKEGDLQRYGSDVVTALVSFRWTIFVKSLLATSLFLLGFSLLGLAAFKAKASVRTLALALGLGTVLLTTWDLMVLDSRFLHPVKVRDFERTLTKTATQSFLAKDLQGAAEPYRIFPLGGEFENNSWMYHRIPSIGGYVAAKLRVYQDLLDYGLRVNQPNAIPNLQIAGMMNARYLIVPGRLPSEFNLVFDDPTGKQLVYENPAALPRAWFVDEVLHEPDLDLLMDHVAGPDFNPTMQAWVVEPIDLPSPDPEARRSAIVPSRSYTAHGFEIHTTTDDSAFLVVSEIWYPQGWTATLDGQPLQIYRTNYALRGVVVPPGEHVIRMSYDPPELKAGAAVSYISLLVILLMIGGHFWLSRRRGVVDATPQADE